MDVPVGPFDRLKQPAYTGENRCLPCTVVNTVIAAVLAASIAVAGTALATLPVGLAGALVVFVVSLLSIYFRGYLVPKTPELTKRYFPPWLLSLFGKGPEQVTIETDVDPEQALVAAGALEECETSDDLCLTAAFGEEWHREIDRVENDPTRQRLFDLIGLDRGEISFDEHGEAFRARVDGAVVGRWESRAAFLADLGAARILVRRLENWEELAVADRGQLLTSLRLFLDICPTCGGTPDLMTDTVESCCSTHTVAAVSCEECGARLFESRVA